LRTKRYKQIDMNPFEKQDIYTAAMLKAYDNGEIPCKDTFSKYFEWKSGKSAYFPFTLEDTFVMCDKAQELLETYYDKYPLANETSRQNDDDSWQDYQCYDEDKYIVSYLEGIDSELTKLRPLLQ